MVRNEKGFTLIELMIVVVIIVILAAIAIPNFVAMQDRARESSVKANMHSLQLAMEDRSEERRVGKEGRAGAAAVAANFPAGTYPTNPFTGVVNEAPTYGAAPAPPGR